MNDLKQRLFVDMDGTLAVFKPVDELETLYEQGYFRNLAPHENVVAAVKEIIANNPDIEVHILSAYLTDSQYALQEKNEWLNEYLPEIDKEHRVFVPCGSDKKEGIEGGLRENDFLLDDYTRNLNDWQPPARGIKLLNAINHTRGSWEHDRIRFDRSPKELADGIVSVMRGERQIYDEKVSQYEREEIKMNERERRFIEDVAKLDYIRGENNRSGIFDAYEPLSGAVEPTAREVYQAEIDRVTREYENRIARFTQGGEGRLFVLSTEHIRDRYAPHDITYNQPLSQEQVEQYNADPSAFLEETYRRLGNAAPQPSNFYGHTPSIGDAFVLLTPDGAFSHYVTSYGFVQEISIDAVMTPEQQRAAALGMTVREERDLLENLAEYARGYGNEELSDLVLDETMGRRDYLREEYLIPLNLASVRAVQESEQDKLRVIHDWEEQNGVEDPITFEYAEGKYAFTNDAVRAAMPDARLANGIYVYEDNRVIAGERLTAEINRRFEKAREYQAENLAYRLDELSRDIDTYGYQDAINADEREAHRDELKQNILAGKINDYISWVDDAINDGSLTDEQKETWATLERDLQTFIGTAEQEVNQESPERSNTVGNERISFYVAESMEFPTMGEYHEGLTLQEAFDLYDQIPAERLNGGKGIGFELQDGSIYDGMQYTLMQRNVVQEELINDIEHYRNSPFVQQAIQDCRAELDRRNGRENSHREETVQEGNEERESELEREQPERFAKGVELAKHQDVIELVAAYETVNHLHPLDSHTRFYGERDPQWEIKWGRTSEQFASFASRAMDAFSLLGLNGYEEWKESDFRWLNYSELVNSIREENIKKFPVLNDIEENRYALLDRMKSDCEYFLGAGNRNENNLWGKNVAEHIANMKALYNSFPPIKKPEWLSMEDIERYERAMVGEIEMPDPSITFEDMANYGYISNMMYPLREEVARQLWNDANVPIYRLYDDNTEGMIDSVEEFAEHAEGGNLFGIEREDWVIARERLGLERRENSAPTINVGDYYADAYGRGIVTEIAMGGDGRQEDLFAFADPEAAPGSRASKGYVMTMALALERLNRGEATLTPAEEVNIKFPEEHEQLTLYDLMNEDNPMPNQYYYPDLDLNGTADELFTQARNGYIESPEALAKLQEILSNPVEQKTEQAVYVGVLKEIAEDNGKQPYVFAQMKKDILDGVQPEEVGLDNGLNLEVRRKGDNILIVLSEIDSEARDGYSTGATTVPVERFLTMTAQEFNETVNAVYAYNMVAEERETEIVRARDDTMIYDSVILGIANGISNTIVSENDLDIFGYARFGGCTEEEIATIRDAIERETDYENEVPDYSGAERDEKFVSKDTLLKIANGVEYAGRSEQYRSVLDYAAIGGCTDEQISVIRDVVEGAKQQLRDDVVEELRSRGYEVSEEVLSEGMAEYDTITHFNRSEELGSKESIATFIENKYLLDNPVGEKDGWFYNDPEKGEILEVYFNPNSIAGGQYVEMHISYELIMEAARDAKDNEQFFGIINDGAYTELVDIDTENFKGAWDHYTYYAPDFISKEGMTARDWLVAAAKSGIEAERSNEPKEQEAVYHIDGADYLHVQVSDEGYDYTFYFDDLKEWDGGRLDNPALSLVEARDEILKLHEFVPTQIDVIPVTEFEQMRENAKSAITPIREFIDNNGHVLEGDQISIVMSQISGHSDRSFVYEAVRDFEDTNNISENESAIHDGRYEDKDILYMAYDRYIGMSHRNDESIKPYKERLQALADSKPHTSLLPLIAEVYYAQQNGLSGEQIDFLLDSAEKEGSVEETVRNLRHGFEAGLSQEQLSVIIGEDYFTQENLVAFMHEGGSIKDATALKGCDIAGYYIISPHLKDSTISRENAQAIIQTVNGIKDWNKADYERQREANPADTKSRFSSMDYEFFIEYLTGAAVKDNSATPEIIANIGKRFVEQRDTNSLKVFIENNGGFQNFVSHREEAKTPERSNTMAQTEDKTAQEGISLPEEKKDAKDLLNEQLQEGIRNVLNTENFKNWLDTGSKMFLNNYSFNNAILVWCQKPDASYTMGYEQWKWYGRNVAQGAQGIKIFMPVIAYEKNSGDLWHMIKGNLDKQMKDNPGAEQAVYRVGMSKLEITVNKNGLYGLRINGKEQGIRSEKDMANFIKHNVLGKVPMYFTVGTVFDVSNTITPEYLWVKKGYTKDELVKGEDGKPIKNRRGEYKIVNTPERKARFTTSLDMSVPQQDPQKMAILYDALKAVSERNGIHVYEKNREDDDTLKNGADGYFSRQFNDENPKGYIVMPTDLDPTKAVSVMLHEISHSELHGDLKKLAEKMGEERIPSHMREVQAESVAYVVGKNFGIETDTSSFQYLAAYTQGFELQALSKSIEVIYNECKQLTAELKTELAVRGLNMDLSERNASAMDKEEVQTLTKSYVEYAVEQDNRIADIEKELPQLAEQNKGKDAALSVLVAQSLNIKQQKNDVSLIKKEVSALESADTLDKQQDCIAKIKAAKERISGYNTEFSDLSARFQELSRNEQGLKDRFIADPVATIKDMGTNMDYVKLGALSNAQIQYLAKSEYVTRELAPLLRNAPAQFEEKAFERASQIDKIISKNGLFVETTFCEQWTDKPIVTKGALMHPKVADTIIKQAETQIRGLKAKAESVGEYFPYCKCALTIYQVEKGELTKVFKTRVDIGDGGQGSLTDHLKQITDAKSLVADFEKATRETGAKEKILFNDANREVAKENPIKEAPPSERAITREEWAQEIAKAKEAVKNEKGEQEQSPEKHNSNREQGE